MRLTAVKEQDVSKAIKDYLDKRRIYNDRLNSGLFETVKSYRDKKTGTVKEFRNWVHGTRKGTPDRFAYWHDAVSQAVLNVAPRNPAGERFSGAISCSDFADCRGLGSGPIRESLITPEPCPSLRGQQCRFALRRHHTRPLFSISDIELRLLQSVGGGEHQSFRQVPRDL